MSTSTTTVTEEQHRSTLPDVVVRYQTARDGKDPTTALAPFTDDAVVEDDGKTDHGRDEVERWLNATTNEFTYTRTLLSMEATEGGWLVASRIQGDFSGAQVDLRSRFELDGVRVKRLVIAP